ncbi:hypothetical protein BC936DRAFT_140244 [Jimgerdemannia flammicorona]|nr:hypothetical protein BC936DRAFT_140244 [Jimgerdemannia flammicorona]
MALIRDRRLVLGRKMLERDHLKTQVERRLDTLDPSWRGDMRVEKWEEEYDFETERASRRTSLSPLSSPKHGATTPQNHSPASSPTTASPHTMPVKLGISALLTPEPRPIMTVRDAPPELMRELERDPALSKEVESVREQLKVTALTDLWHRVQEEKKVIRRKIEEEEEKREKYKQELLRRKYDYRPFIVEFMKRLDRVGLLRPMMG